MPITHPFVSAKSDSADATLIRASNWNAARTNLLAITAVSGNYSALDTDEMLECTAGAGGFTLTLPTAVGRGEKIFEFKRIDAGIGNVTMDGAGSETIDGTTTYVLTKQWQLLIIYADGANWKIRGQN
jgi:hypothetical protein